MINKGHKMPPTLKKKKLYQSKSSNFYTTYNTSLSLHSFSFPLPLPSPPSLSLPLFSLSPPSLSLCSKSVITIRPYRKVKGSEIDFIIIDNSSKGLHSFLGPDLKEPVLIPKFWCFTSVRHRAKSVFKLALVEESSPVLKLPLVYRCTCSKAMQVLRMFYFAEVKQEQFLTNFITRKYSLTPQNHTNANLVC